jgi:exopolysaccharide biosynthesis polyprenyl glycosylphosphotransferase
MVTSHAPGEPGVVRRSPAWEGYQRHLKRGFDIAVALIALIVTAPVLVAIALAIRLETPGPAIFRQTRLGKNGKPFTFYKFRGMVVDAEARRAEIEHLNEADGPIFKIRHDPRVTRVGRFLRRTSLDELPQLWNVLKGDMSLVGPRPPIPSVVVQYEPWQHGRLAVPGGISGLWQVAGRGALSFDEMVRLDIQYIAEWSFWLDLRIIFHTFAAVVTTRGAY